MASGPGRAVLSTMLDRLLAGLMAGPNMNCRPHASRQRVDLTQLAKLNDASAESVLHGLLGEGESARVVAKVRPPRKVERKDGEPETEGQRRYREQSALLAKLRTIADEARTYENDTGVAALAVGFPLLSVPPPEGEGKRILAPVAFVPVSLVLKGGGTPSVELTSRAGAGDRVRPNAALMAWVEQQTGHAPPAENDDDADPWGELRQLVAHVAAALDVADPFPPLAAAEPAAEPPGSVEVEVKRVTPPIEFVLVAAPRTDDESDAAAAIVPAAVLGLFPVPNQGLLRDTRAMMGEEPAGPVRAFLTAGVDFDAPPKAAGPAVVTPTGAAWLAAAADPCQARAVSLAREGDGGALVVHGPPGTGKSQTITNVIADHLYRGQRVLLVCDKRTALDVVADRLGHLGLRSLCAIVHDPRRDQRDLYRTIKDQLDALPKASTKPQAEGQLLRVDGDLRAVHDELLQFHRSLMVPSAADHTSFSDLVGRWLALGTDPDVRVDEAAAAGVTVDAVADHRATLGDLFDRARAVDWPRNPWARCGGPPLAAYMARPMAAVRATMARCVAAAAAADATVVTGMPAFNAAVPLADQGRARAAWGGRLAEALPDAATVPGLIALAKQRPEDVRATLDLEARKDATLAVMRATPLDAELTAALVPLPSLAEVKEQAGVLQLYAAKASSWTGVFNFAGKAAATRVLGRYGQPLSAAAAERVGRLLAGVKARLTLATARAATLNQTVTALPADDVLEHHSATVVEWAEAVLAGMTEPALAGVAEPLGRAVSDAPATDALLAGLAASPARAEALNRLDEELLAAGLFGPAWLGEFAAQQRRGESAVEPLRTLADRVDSLEGVLRVRDARAGVPNELGPAVDALVTQGADATAAVAALDRAAVEGAIARRLAADPILHQVDGRRIEHSFDRHRELSARRREHVRDAALHQWVTKQKGQFTEAAGTKLGRAGADLKRRLTTRGKNANRLRQVFADGGDALLDVCPVWMASPETVAQVFPRRAVFDVVVFDEASQCRLEEALPVLVRGRRAVIAGDPHQLPPTRFFESGLVRSGDGEDDDGDEQSLFEAHQANVEDLLSAALNLSVRQCYLDVHYRSRSADLIAFSNEHFYGSRLVPIPTRPTVGGDAAVKLHRVDGVYEHRRNPAEADAVVALVRELLSADDAPSIGVACLNLPQRDLIVEKLDEAAEADGEFAERLSAARARSGAGSSDGLFVKNLENVQGDERDQIIISTTYGPRPDGRFHRRFGPLGMPGGGRRLNVLVTRARDRVHLVTSIPGEAYRALPPVPDGQQAGGAWLLFAYLGFAESLANAQRSTGGDEEADGDRPTDVDRSPDRHPTRYPSALVDGVAARLGPAEVYWGNDGFCVDVAPVGGDVGILVDGCRYAAADDPVDWDVFRTGVLAGQGWRLARVWSPHFFRDPDGALRALGASEIRSDPSRS